MVSPGGAHLCNNTALIDALRSVIRAHQYSIRTEKSCVDWVQRFLSHFPNRPASTLGEAEVRAYLTHLSVGRNVAVATQQLALCVIVFLFRHLLEKPLGDFGDFIRAKRSRRLPVVLSQQEV